MTTNRSGRRRTPWHAAAVAALALATTTAGAQPALLDKDRQCLAPPFETAATPAQQIVQRLTNVLASRLPAYEAMAQSQADRATLICIDDRAIDARGYLDVTNNLIALKSTLSEGEMLAILLHELRHLDQLDRGYCPTNQVSMQENARAMMATEADAMAITALLAWGLREAGEARAWQALLDWPRYGDIGLRFAAEMAASNDLGQAVSAAFDQWYDSDWRVESYYAASCSDYLDRLDRSKQLPRYDLLPGDFLDNLCRLPDGTAYACNAE